MKRKFVTIYTVPEVTNKGYMLTVQPCQEGVYFEKDKPIRFDVSLTKEGNPCSEGELYAYFNWNSEKVLWHRFLDHENGTSSIDFTCEWSGFGNLHVLFYLGDEEILEQIRGIAVSPDMLKRSYPCPDDFDSFWNEKKKTIDVPFKAEYTPIDETSHPELHDFSHKTLIERDHSAVDIHDVQVDCPAGNVSGILTRPKERKSKSLPALLFLHGAGVRPCEPGHFVGQAARGVMVFDMNAHGIPNDKPQEWYRELQENGRLKDYQYFGIESRETFYFLNMYLRVKRGLDFLKNLEEWDGKILVAMGCSQGSAQAFAGSYLEPQVTAVVGTSLAYGDLTGFLCGRKVNFIEWLKMGPRGRMDRNILNVAPYFDTVNFLRNYHGALCAALGVLDQGCLPTTNYVSISECPADATVILQSDCYHAVSPQAEEMTWDFVFEHIGKKEVISDQSH